MKSGLSLKGRPFLAAPEVASEDTIAKKGAARSYPCSFTPFPMMDYLACALSYLLLAHKIEQSTNRRST